MQNLTRLMSARGLKPAQLSKLAGLNITAVRDILEGRSLSPQYRTLSKLARALDCSVDDLAPDAAKVDQLAIVTGVETRFSAGGGGLLEVEHDQPAFEQWGFPDAWLRIQLKAAPRDLKVITVDGDSMLGTIDPGDKIVVDLSQRKPSPEGIFVIWDGIGLVVKRLHHVPNTSPPKIQIMSDNARYPPYERTVDEITIFGRVVVRLQRY